MSPRDFIGRTVASGREALHRATVEDELPSLQLEATREELTNRQPEVVAA